MIVRVPASTANLGPGFDTLGMALTLWAEVGVVDGPVPPRARVVDERHPADVAFRQGEGRGELWLRSSIPVGRGLGFSGAMRVGGLVAAAAQRASGPDDVVAARPAVLELAVELEGHADNVGASLYGGVIATAAGRVVPVPMALDAVIVAWIPAHATSTHKSRAALAGTVSFSDAVFNVGRTALLVAALAAGDIEALGVATADRLHQDRRFAAFPPSHVALADGLAAGAWCGWLSGSGPSVALLCDPSAAATIAAALPPDGHTKRLRVAPEGATVRF
jgi:homoserine kinase